MNVEPQHLTKILRLKKRVNKRLRFWVLYKVGYFVLLFLNLSEQVVWNALTICFF